MGGFAVNQGSALNSATGETVGVAEPVGFWDAAKRGSDAFWNVQRGGSREEAVRAAMWRRNSEIRQRTGQSLTPSNLMNGDDAPINRAIDLAISPLQRLIGDEVTDDDYEAQVDALRGKHPQAMTGIETRAQIMARLQADWTGKANAAAEASGSGMAGAVGVFAGGAGASMVEPENLAISVMTGGVGAGRSLATRMLMQAAANAGVETTLTPARAIDAAKYGGPEYGAKEAAVDVAGAAVAGAAFEGGASALRTAWRSLRPSPRTVERGDLSNISLHEDGALRQAGEIADQALRDDAAIGLRDGAEHQAALRSLELFEPPPAVEPARDLSQLFPGDVGATEYRGRPIQASRFDATTLDVDPSTFQYKADGDAEGVTARLRGVEAWDATASGKVIVYEEMDGRLVVADGHQRRGLALRLEQKGFDAPLDGYLFRARDGWKPEEVRTVAALKNIREGSGSPLDAAKIFRDAPSAIDDPSLPVTGDFISHGRGLARLSDEAFGAVVNKVIPERYASEIGLIAGHRPDLHADMVRLMRQAEPANADEARALVMEALQDDWIRHEGDQVDLFGYDPSVSAMIARAKIAASVKRDLAADTRLFAQLVKKADAIEAGGNALARDANEARLAIDRAALEVTAKLALRAGPIGEAMADAVARVSNGEAPGAAAKGVLARVRAAVEAGERLDGARADLLDPKPPSPAAERLLDDFDQVGGKGQEAQATAAPEDMALEQGARAAMAAEIDQVLEAAGAPGHAPHKAQLGAASDWLVAEAREAGLEIEGFAHVLDGSAVRHVVGNHGNAKKEAARGQIGVTEADFRTLPDVLSEPDAVVFGSTGRRGEAQVFYVKEMQDGSTLVVEEVRRGRKELALQSMRRVPGTIDDARLSKLADPNAQDDAGTLKIVRPPKGASAVDEPSLGGLFDDLAVDDRHEKGFGLLKGCAPGGK